MKLKNIMFVCHGNICRSPMAEFVFKDMVNKRGLAEKFYIEYENVPLDNVFKIISAKEAYETFYENLSKTDDLLLNFKIGVSL